VSVVSLFSASWYRIAGVKPRLRSHVRIYRHYYRNRLWYVLQDAATGKQHRFSPASYTLIGLMDGCLTLDQIWHQAGHSLGDAMPSQDEVVRLLSQLHQAGVVQADVSPDIAELYKRSTRERRAKLFAVFKSPLAVKIPFLDPEIFLNRTRWLASLLFNPLVMLLWLWCIGWALLQTAIHWDALTENLADRVLATENLLLLWLVYPVVKLIHEFGHAYAVKRWGGEVHEMGLMFLIFVPIPYVDASASTAFESKYRRMLVASAGILLEMLMAAVAMAVWVRVEPGATRAIAFNVMMIAGVSTLLFNGNPLLRFDAYYVLADWLEIPNLAGRGNKQLGWWLRKQLLGVKDQESPAYSAGEGRWMLGYSIASFCYRLFITVTIALFVASKLFFIGLLLACWSLFSVLIKPLYSVVRYLIMDAAMQERRGRVMLVCGLGLVLLTGLLWVLPLPKMTSAQGVLWAPEESRLQVGTNGFIDDLLVEQGSQVTRGTALLASSNPELDARIQQQSAQLKELQVRYRAAVGDRAVEARLIGASVEQVRAQLNRSLEEQDALTIRSPVEGTFQLTLPEDPLGRFLPRGTLLGYVLQPGKYLVRVAVDQDSVQNVREDTQALEVRIAERFSESLAASLVAEVPSAQKMLPGAALSVDGGGLFALDPKSRGEAKAFDSFFVFELQLEQAPAHRIGERVYVRFEHSPEPLGYRLYRTIRRVLLRELDF
jgi:putative peptide zinc metalloprotease protein